MTRKAARTLKPVRLSQNASTPQLADLSQALIEAERVARSVGKSRNKLRDPFWLDEATTEGYFIVTELILTSFDEIVVKYAEPHERYQFYRMSVGYGIKGYFAYRPISTLRYLKAKGIEAKHMSFEEGYIGKEDQSAMMSFILDEVTRTAMEKKVLEFYLMGNSWEDIASKVELEVRRVKKVMRRVKKRLKDAQVPLD